MRMLKNSYLKTKQNKKKAFGKYFQGKKTSQFLEMIKQSFIKIFHLSFS